MGLQIALRTREKYNEIADWYVKWKIYKTREKVSALMKNILKSTATIDYGFTKYTERTQNRLKLHK